MRTVEVKDYIALTVENGLPELGRLNAIAHDQVAGQYTGKLLRSILMDPIDWFITNEPDEVERYQPAHDCAECRAGNVAARVYLVAHPGAWIALGNLSYTELWD